MKLNSICYEIGGMSLGDGYKENGVWVRLEETLGVRKMGCGLGWKRRWV